MVRKLKVIPAKESKEVDGNDHVVRATTTTASAPNSGSTTTASSIIRSLKRNRNDKKEKVETDEKRITPAASTTTTPKSSNNSSSGRYSPVLIVFGIMLLPAFVNIYTSMDGKSLQSVADMSSSYEAFLPSLEHWGNITTTTTTTSTKMTPTEIPSISISERNHIIQEALHISRERLIERVPKWTIDYFDWQQEQLAKINKDNWKDFRYLVLRCSRFDRSCGGMTDRLKPLPLFLRVAKQSRRILLIRWERPHPMEEFLLPTPHFNWTVPSFINDFLHKGRLWIKQQPQWNHTWQFQVKSETILQDAVPDLPTILEVKKQLHDGGVELYGIIYKFNETEHETYLSMYHGIFRGMFQPHPAIEQIVKQQWDTLGLTPGKYNVAHSRNFYKIQMEKVSKQVIEFNSINVAKCASALSPGYPLYFASDSVHATNTIDDYALKHNYTIFTNTKLKQANKLTTERDPLHLDFAGRGNKTYPVEDFYDAFVDMFVLGNSKCVAYSKGGYGDYASMLSWDAHCKFWTYKAVPRKNADGSVQRIPDGHVIFGLKPKFCDNFVDNNPRRVIVRPTTPSTPLIRQQQQTPLIQKTKKETTALPSNILPAPSTASTQTSSLSDISTQLPESRDDLIRESLHISRERLIQRVPKWVMEFFEWQQAELAKINQHNWKDFRYLVLRCSRHDRACGGMTDRLKPLPLLLRVAHESKRIFLIRWEKPYRIEEFLLPTPYLNWTVPSYIDAFLYLGRKKISSQRGWKNLWMYSHYTEEILQDAQRPSPAIVEVKKQIHDGGVELYSDIYKFNAQEHETYESMYHGIFRGMFQPHPGIERLIKQQWDTMGLTPAHYNVAHSRNFYKIKMEKVPKSMIEGHSLNVVKCASALVPGFPLYFASDSSYAVRKIDEYAAKFNYTIFTNTKVMEANNASKRDPLHLDFAGRGNKTFPPEDFYDAFVDMYVLGSSRCVAYSAGGYGAYASMLSWDANCKYWTYRQIPRKNPDGSIQRLDDGHIVYGLLPRHCSKFVDNNPSAKTQQGMKITAITQPRLEYFPWKEAESPSQNTTRQITTILPSTTNGNTNDQSTNMVPFSASTATTNLTPVLDTRPQQPHNRDALIQEALHISRDRLVQRVPKWAMEFFDWQQSQLERINESNWKSFRYLVMRCSRLDPACGGMTDRLSSVPLILRVAYESKRIVFIRWERPYPLESFFMPTPHINWTAPSYINETLYNLREIMKGQLQVPGKNTNVKEDLNNFYLFNVKTETMLKDCKKEFPTIVEIKKQLHGGGNELYNDVFKFNETEGESYHGMYHGIFRGMFQPSPPVERLVKEQWDIMGLTPGHYSVGHSRNFYKKKMERVSRNEIKFHAINTVKCASTLSPGDPIYFASDSSYARQVVEEFANKNKFAIYMNAIQNNTDRDPLHLDFAGRGNKTWPVEDFYDSFVDILVLGNSRCVTHSMGSYGRFANQLSFDPSCKIWTYEPKMRMGRDGKPLRNRQSNKIEYGLKPRFCDHFVDNNPTRLLLLANQTAR